MDFFFRGTNITKKKSVYWDRCPENEGKEEGKGDGKGEEKGEVGEEREKRDGSEWQGNEGTGNRAIGGQGGGSERGRTLIVNDEGESSTVFDDYFPKQISAREEREGREERGGRGENNDDNDLSSLHGSRNKNNSREYLDNNINNINNINNTKLVKKKNLAGECTMSKDLLANLEALVSVGRAFVMDMRGTMTYFLNPKKDKFIGMIMDWDCINISAAEEDMTLR